MLYTIFIYIFIYFEILFFHAIKTVIDIFKLIFFHIFTDNEIYLLKFMEILKVIVQNMA